MSDEIFLTLGIGFFSLAIGLTADDWRRAFIRAAGLSIVLKLAAGLLEIAPAVANEWLFSAGWFARLAGMGIGYALIALLGLFCRRATTWVVQWIRPNVRYLLNKTIKLSQDNVDFARDPRGLKTKRPRPWLGIGAAVVALAVLLPFVPDTRDRWVITDGAPACQDSDGVEDIESSSSQMARRDATGDLVAGDRCILLFANERVRIQELSTDGSSAKVVLGRDGQLKWVSLSKLKLQGSGWGDFRWRWPNLSFPSPQLATEEALVNNGDRYHPANPFDKFDTSETSHR